MFRKQFAGNADEPDGAVQYRSRKRRPHALGILLLKKGNEVREKGPLERRPNHHIVNVDCDLELEILPPGRERRSFSGRFDRFRQRQYGVAELFAEIVRPLDVRGWVWRQVPGRTL